MLLLQLVEYQKRLEAERAEGEEVPSGYQKKPIKTFFKLNMEGELLEIYQTSDGNGKKKDSGKMYIAPHVNRNGTKARLLVDNPDYVLGLSEEDLDKKASERHEVFKILLSECYEETKVKELQAIISFLSNFSLVEVKSKLPENFDLKQNMSFEIEGKFPFMNPEIQVYWKNKVMGSEEVYEVDGQVFVAESLISGKIGPVMEREPVRIKGIPGELPTGMSFISADKAPFLSYGLEASQIAPVTKLEAEQYANALNSLLKDKNTHLRLGGMVYAFWTREGDVPNLNETLTEPESVLNFDFGDEIGEHIATSRPEQIKEALKKVYQNKNSQPNLNIDEVKFYAVGLSASGSRIVVRNHIQSTVGQLFSTLGYFYGAQYIWSGADAKFHGIFALLASLYRDARKEITRFDADRMLAFAFNQEPLPFTFLQKAVARNRADKNITHPRAAIIKATLISRRSIAMGELEQLDLQYPNPAYHLGRLLAILDEIQNSVMKANATVVDRFYGALSTTPASVLGRVMQGSQHHLAKLRKEKPNVYSFKQRDLEEVMSHLTSVPKILNLEDQAIFSLGYYHQRAHASSRIKENSERKKEKESDQEKLF